jgi:spermidine synthase
VVEINPGYLQLLPLHPEVASLTHDRKVKIIVDDGRRWLSAHPEERFDLVVSNTTFNWRSGVSALLSREFLTLVSSHMNAGAIFAFNTTSSTNAQHTAAEGFPFAIRADNFMIVSDQPIVIDPTGWRQFLETYHLGGHPIFDLEDPHQRQRIDALVAWGETYGPQEGNSLTPGLETRESILARTVRDRPVTDDNMGTEWTLRDMQAEMQ